MQNQFRVSFIIPNAITLAGTCLALTGIRYALAGLWENQLYV